MLRYALPHPPPSLEGQSISPVVSPNRGTDGICVVSRLRTVNPNLRSFLWCIWQGTCFGAGLSSRKQETVGSSAAFGASSASMSLPLSLA